MTRIQTNDAALLHRRATIQLRTILTAASLLVIGAICSFSASNVSAEESRRPEIIGVYVGDDAYNTAVESLKTIDARILVQLPDAKAVEIARRSAAASGELGRRLFIEQGDATHIHLADNIATVAVIAGDVNGDNAVAVAEALRVVHPQGTVFQEGQDPITKPFPEGIDDWSHPYHGPDNNPQSNDRVVQAPYLTQFLAEPYYAPLPQLATASAGRIFKAYGHIAFKPREEPLLDTLVAYNGYNGIELWRRPMTPGLMIHRSTLIATPDVVYLGDDKSCKVIDAANGELKEEIVPPLEIAGGTFWKWMALEDGVLYALLGADEPRDPVIRMNRKAHGWPWTPLSPGYNQASNPWGFGNNLLAIDPKTKEVLWHYAEETSIDSRSVCMKNGKIFFMRFGAYVGCVDAKTGKSLWRKTPTSDPELFEAIGENLNRQDWRTNWRTAAYLKCGKDAVYLAGTMFNQLLALSAEDGSILWKDEYNNYQLVLRDDGLYAISGQLDVHASKKLDPLTGENLGNLAVQRRGCARPTGAADAVFFRADGGSVRFDLQTNERQWISPMRAQCHDGITIANGLLYWWPSTCDCQLTLYGMTALGPAGDFDFSAEAVEAERLQLPENPADFAAPHENDADWPTYRANNTGRATSKATIAPKSQIAWQSTPKYTYTPTAPVTVDGRIFVGGSDGVVRALDALTGEEIWTAFTGGAIRMAPTVWKGRVFVGSGDGWVYSYGAVGGELLWRFRAAPVERMIPVYGSLLSTWPVASGVLIEDEIAYFAAGIANYDGTHVYALDATTGEIKWQNTTSGHLDPNARTGISVQGQMLLHDGKLYLAGGTSISPAVYDVTNGKCLNDPEQLKECYSIYPRGAELSLFGDQVFACGQPLYKSPDADVHDPSATEKVFLASAGKRDVFWADNNRIVCTKRVNKDLLNAAIAARKRNWMIPAWGELKFKEEPLWKHDCPNSRSVALCKNAVVVASDADVTAVDLEKGTTLWRQPLPAPPVNWGMAVDRDGRAIITLKNGQVVCIGPVE